MDIILYLLIGLWFVWIDDKYFAIGSSEVHINGNITAEVNSNDIRLECSFTLGEGDAFYSTALTAENATTNKFIEIAGYLRNSKPLFTPFGMDFFGNKTTLIHFDENHNMFTLAFDNVTCRQERRYKCLLLVTSSDSVLPRLFESDAIWISVTVPPSKPEMNLPTKVNDLSGGKRNKRSATIMPKNDTHEKDVLTFIEGDNITFICEGDVGRPEGRFEWQKMYANDKILIYSNTLSETIPESCSYDGNSTLTIQVTGDDNQAVIRCSVKSEVSQVPVYEDSEPLRIQFQVRKPVITLQPDKAVFLEGDSITLNCQSDGNPVPSYAWLKGNGSNETIIAYTDRFVIENANITDSSLYTCYTNNSLDGNIYQEINSTYIIIAEKSTRPSTSTLNTIGSDNTKDLHIAAISGGVAFFTVVLFVIVVCICKKRFAKSKNLAESKDSNIMLNCNPKHPDQSKSSGYESVDMDGETPVLSSKSNGNEHAVTDFVKQHNENYLQNQKEEDEKVKKSPGSHQHVEYAQVDETKKLKNKNKQNDTDQETKEKNGETKFESEEMHAKKDKNVDRFDEPMISNNEHSDQETESSVTTSDHIIGRVNQAFENDDVSSKDETIKVAMVSPIIRMAEPHIEHKQNGPTNVESKDRVNLSQTADDDDDYCNAIRNSTSSASPADTKQKENRNADTPQGIHERSDRTVDNAQYFDTSSYLESVASSEETKQKENKNAEARLGINERSGRTVDNAEYFDTTTLFEKQHNHNDPETAIQNDQTKSYTNQAFDGEDNQEKDAVSSPVQLLDRLQVDEQNNQNNDKQSKHDYENVGSTAQPESSNGETI